MNKPVFFLEDRDDPFSAKIKSKSPYNNEINHKLNSSLMYSLHNVYFVVVFTISLYDILAVKSDILQIKVI
jgi:hypothetical protein